MKRLLREPLLHFLLAGGLLFLAFDVLAPEAGPPPDSRTVLVDRDALLTFIQYRTKRFDPARAEARLAAMSDQERQLMIDDYVREEVLHREALALGLGVDDYVIRRRLVQKLEFITEGIADAGAQPDEAAIAEYYEANKAQYAVDPSVTFTHVYFDAERRGREAAHGQAKTTLEQLNAAGAGFNDGLAYGDYFPYHRNYVERAQDDVGAHLGADMAAAIFTLDAGTQWQGPMDSPLGVHLVYLSQSMPGRIPPLDEIRQRLVDDLRRDLIRDKTDQTVRELIDSYDVRVTYEPETREADGVAAQ